MAHLLVIMTHSNTQISKWTTHFYDTVGDSLVLFIGIYPDMTHFDDTRDGTVDDTLIRHSRMTHLMSLSCVINHFSPRLVNYGDADQRVATSGAQYHKMCEC